MAESTPLELITATQAAQVEESLTLLSAAADPVRWTVLRHLAQNGTSCVCDLQDRVPVASNLLSYHLKVLREAGLIEGTRRGRWIDYALTDGALERLHAALPDPALVARQLVVVR